MEDRLVLERDHVPWVGRVRRPSVSVARATDLRSVDYISAKNVVIARRLEEIWIDILSRGAVLSASVRIWDRSEASSVTRSMIFWTAETTVVGACRQKARANQRVSTKKAIRAAMMRTMATRVVTLRRSRGERPRTTSACWPWTRAR